MGQESGGEEIAFEYFAVTLNTSVFTKIEINLSELDAIPYVLNL